MGCTLKFARDEAASPAARSSSSVMAERVPDEVDAASLQPGIIGAGDLLQITVYGEKDLTNLYQVSPEGVILFPFIGEITAKGMSNFSLAERIAEKLKDGYVKNPQVHILVKEFNSRRLFVLGQVKNAGKFSIVHDMSIIEAIALAGGFTNLADIDNVVVTRRDETGKEVRYVLNVDAIVSGKTNNFYLLPGDIVFVRERFF